MKWMLLFIIVNVAQAETIKLAALAPKGTNWANSMQKMAKEIKDKTSGRVKLKIYYGGVAGDEPDVLRKIRIGQLHGGVFTGKTLGEIFSDIRAVELPFNFYQDREKAKRVLDEMMPYFTKGLAKRGFQNLGMYELGNVYVVSTKKVTSIQEMKGIKIWAWEGDKVVAAMIESLELVSVPLSLPDVMSSLSTGIIDSAYAPALGIMALQWNGKVKYLVDFPTAYSIGALLIDQKIWSKISAGDQQIVESISKKYVELANKMAVEDNLKGLAQLKQEGIEFIQFNKSDLAKAEEVRLKVIQKLKGNFLSKEVLDILAKKRM